MQLKLCLPTLSLLLLLLLLLQLQHSVVVEAAGDVKLKSREFCDACQVVVEESGRVQLRREKSYLDIQDKCLKLDPSNPTYSECVAQNARFMIADNVYRMCDDAEFKKLYNKDVQDTCEYMRKEENIDVLVKAWVRHASDMDSAHIFDRKRQVCTKLSKSCGKRMKKAARKPTTECTRCKSVANGLHSLFSRQRGVLGFGSKKHVWAVLDVMCADLLMRFSRTVTDAIQETCDDLIDEHDSELANLLMDRPTMTPREFRQEVCVEVMEACDSLGEPAAAAAKDAEL